MFEKDSVATTNRHFAIPLRIPCKTDPRSGIEQVTLHAGIRRSIYSALNQSKVADNSWIQCESIRIERHHGRSGAFIEQCAAERIHSKPGSIEVTRDPVPGVLVFVIIGSKQADP